MNDSTLFPRPEPVSLRALAVALGASSIDPIPELLVSGVYQDSRKVEPGALFVARTGARTSGVLYLDQAISRGAVALLVERGKAPQPCSVPVLEVEDVRQAVGRAAAIVYQDPSSKLDVVGITGTNGKTTTAWLTAAALAGCGKRPGFIGTIGYLFEDLRLDAPHTTPEADDLIRLASQMVLRGATHLVMEVASHALSQARVDTMRFRVAAFSNLTQDHLDFHGNMEAYGRAKARLFHDLAPGTAVINVDDAFGSALADSVRVPVLRVSGRVGSSADIVPVGVELTIGGIRASVQTPSGLIDLDSRLIGAHNLDNLLLALGISVALGLPLQGAAGALSAAGNVPGRLDRCDEPADQLAVFVDYAHTPDALDRALSVLASAAALHGGRVVCVFGCGGDRDPTKRAPMGAVVGRHAQLAVVTSDNPRSEDPNAIIEQILPGFEGSRAEIVVEPDRARAIHLALGRALPGDLVLVAGKGHETYQIIGSTTRHFDDREEVRAALGSLREARGSR